ncbi:MAG: Fic family protein [Succinivibrio sp.]
MEYCKIPRSRTEKQQYCNLMVRRNFVDNYLNILVKHGFLFMTLEDKPNSKNQKYYSK